MDKKEDSSEIEAFKSSFDSNTTSDINEIIILFFNRFIRILKNNATLILLIIYSLGSAVQIIELTSINISYIKFFSVSQLISDGAFILTLSLILYLAIKFFTYLFSIFQVSEKLNKSLKNNKYLKTKGYLLLLSSLSSPLFFTFVAAGVLDKMLYTIIIITAFLYIFLNELIDYSYKYDDCVSFYDSDNKIGHGDLFRSLMTGAVLLTLILLPTVILKFYRIPDNLDNYSKAYTQIRYDYKGIKNEEFKILYFNDKYMFVEINKRNNRTIAMYETHSMLFDTRVIFLNEE